jgi:hypothetical protein
MTKPTPIRDGFSAAWRQPSIFFAELSWRWSFGAAALLLAFLALYEYLHTLYVSRGDLLLLRTNHPVLVSQALAHIFRGSGPRLVAATLVLVITLSLLWIIVAALGRAAVLRALLDRLAPDVAPAPRPFKPLLGLHFLRVALALAALVSVFGATILAGFLTSPKTPRPGLVFLAFLALAGCVLLAWSTVNWYLSLGALFAVRDGKDTFAALDAATDLCRRRSGTVSAVSFGFGILHLVAFFIGTTIVAFPLSLANLLPPSFTFALVAIVTLVYFALADWFYLARLAAYVSVVEWDRRPPEPEPEPQPMPPPTTRFEDDEPLFAIGGREAAPEEPPSGSTPPLAFPGAEPLPQS